MLRLLARRSCCNEDGFSCIVRIMRDLEVDAGKAAPGEVAFEDVRSPRGCQLRMMTQCPVQCPPGKTARCPLRGYGAVW
jgi:hypothetical protein